VGGRLLQPEAQFNQHVRDRHEVQVKFKKLRNFSFNILPKSMKGQQQEHKGDSDDDERYQQHPQPRRLPIVDSHLLGRVLATAETQLSGPPGFFFAAMPSEHTPQKLASKKKFEAASARKRRAKQAAKMAASVEIRPDGSMGAAKTA
jgi:hypothetical protein